VRLPSLLKKRSKKRPNRRGEALTLPPFNLRWDVLEQLQQIRSSFNSDLKEAQSLTDLEQLEVKFLGRKGPVQGAMKLLKEVSSAERPKVGKEINEIKQEIEQALQDKKASFESLELEEKLAGETIDTTLPGRRRFLGAEHLINKELDHAIDTLREMGFSVQYGPDIESSYYNFEALNFPPDHPAMDMQDTFYIDGKEVLLRTHTSNIQVRFMEGNTPPIRIIAPGKAYRNESISRRSHVFFHQVEALYVDKQVSFSDLMATLEDFFQRIFHEKVEVRFRPSYFPFVEPGMEVDIGCLVCSGEGCPICKHTGWLEVAGAGMVHPEVLKNGGIDPEEYSGYAWGMGIERLVMLKYGIQDIRTFTENDMRFLKQFA